MTLQSSHATLGKNLCLLQPLRALSAQRGARHAVRPRASVLGKGRRPTAPQPRPRRPQVPPPRQVCTTRTGRRSRHLRACASPSLRPGSPPLRLRASCFPQARWRPGDQSGAESERVAGEPGWRGEDPGAAAEVCLREVAAGQGLCPRRSWGGGRDCRSRPRG